jgi:CDP-glucose 4,6-dehydratase
MDAPHEAKYLRLNCRKASQQLGWVPALNLQQALDWTVDWYRAYYEDPATAQSVTTAQIQKYMAGLR